MIESDCYAIEFLQWDGPFQDVQTRNAVLLHQVGSLSDAADDHYGNTEDEDLAGVQGVVMPAWLYFIEDGMIWHCI